MEILNCRDHAWTKNEHIMRTQVLHQGKPDFLLLEEDNRPQQVEGKLDTVDHEGSLLGFKPAICPDNV